MVMVNNIIHKKENFSSNNRRRQNKLKLNSIIFKMMIPLLTITSLLVSIAFFAVHTYLHKVVQDITIDLRIHHIEEISTLKIESILLEMKRAAVEIISSKDLQKFILSKDALEGKISQSIKQKLSDIKNLHKLDTIYIAHVESRNYFNEDGFIQAVNPSKKESGWFVRTLQSKKDFLISAESNSAGKPYIYLDEIVESKDEPVALAGVGMDISNIFEIVLEDFHKKCVNVIILNDENLIYASSNNSDLLNRSLHESGLSKEKIDAIENARQSNKKLVQYMVERQLRNLLFIPIKELKWAIVVDFSKNNFLQSTGGVDDKNIVGGVILLFLLLVIGGLTFLYLVSRPLKKISIAVNNFDYSFNFELKNCKKMCCEFDTICMAFKKSYTILQRTIEKHNYKEKLLKNIIDSADDFILYKDTKSMYLGGNSAFESLNSRKLEEIIGKTDKELYPAEVASYHIKTDRRAIEEKKTIIVEERFQKEDGSIVVLQVKKSPIYDSEGSVKGVVAVARDMTHINEMEQALLSLNLTLENRVEKKTQELQAANEKLEGHITDLERVNYKLRKAKTEALQAAQARSNFLTSMSHELRTPLNAIINFSDQVIEDFDEMLEDKELQEDTKIFMQRVLVNSRHLLNLINDLLEFTKAEAGKIDYKIEQCDLNLIIKTAYNNTYSLLNGTDVIFNLNLHEMPLIAEVDSRRFLQILLNLLSNAIKFTQKGEIELRSFEEKDHTVVEVKDSGKGIPQDKQSIIFEPFMQVSNTDNGTGLGLGLVKRMCDDMGIKISFSSIEGEGTSFRLAVNKSL